MKTDLAMKLVQLFERADSNLSSVFAMAKGAERGLSYEAQRALERWLSFNWTSGSLSVDFQSGETGSYRELYDAFEPIRNQLRKVYGPDVLLYRGMRSGGSSQQPNRLYSWTFDEQVARGYAFPNTKRATEPLSAEQIAELVARYEKVGVVRYRNYYLKRDSKDPEFFDIYDKNKQHITVDDDIEAFIKNGENDIEQSNQAHHNEGVVSAKRIPVKDIVWFVPNAEKEVIVVGHAK